MHYICICYLDLPQLFFGLVFHGQIVQLVPDGLQRVPQAREAGVELARRVGRRA